MNWEEALEEIQSVEFDVNLNVVSSTNAFFRAVAKEPTVLEALQQMREAGELREDVLGRIHDLAELEADPRYENPNDTALAVLLWLTYFAAGDFVPMAAAMVDRAPNCWYASKLAHRILSPPPAATGNYQFGETSLRPKATAVSYGNLKFTMSPFTERPLKFYEGNSEATSTTPVTMWQIPDKFSAVTNEGIS